MEEVLAREARPPTIRDVARHAGVSVATVSRVLNDVPVVSDDMRDRVREAISTLGYRPSSAARSLSLGRSQAIGVVAPFFTSPSVVERVRGVAECARERGYGLMLFDVETAEQRQAGVAGVRRRARAGGRGRLPPRRDRVDGLLVISLPLSDDDVDGFARDRLPVVMVDSGHPRVTHVAIDDA